MNDYQARANWQYLVTITMGTERIDRSQAESRIRALLNSKELDGVESGSEEYNTIVNKYLSTPVK